MRLFIAEKPQLAEVIANALGTPVKSHGYFTVGDDVVTWCVGHLLELLSPEEHNPALKEWSWETLPLPLRPHKYKPIERTASQFNVVASLLKKADQVVHAGDPDDEGQLLVDEVLQFTNCNLPVKRVLINDMNTKAAQKALQNLRDNSEFAGLSRKALARSVGDQIFGFNMTRAYTLANLESGRSGVFSVGRVQTPVHGLICRRYRQNKEHKDAYYYSATATLKIGGHDVPAKLIVPEGAPVDEKGRIIQEDYINGVKAQCESQTATLLTLTIADKETPPRLPFSLLDLQARMSTLYGYTAQETLDITQSLRDKHSAITYNRSDCSYLSSEQHETAPGTLSCIGESVSVLKNLVDEANPVKKSRAFDDSKITAHTAIIPAETTVNLSAMTEQEKNVYLEIARYFIAQFLENKKYQKVDATFEVAGYQFATACTKTTDEGWKKLFLNDKDEEEDEDDNTLFSVISGLNKGDTGSCHCMDVKREKVSPPPLYTEATLLKDLRRVAAYVTDEHIRSLLISKDDGKTGENGGIGTPATRAAIIETLKERGFITVEKKKIIPTEVGLKFFDLLPESATVPDMTALWHEQQSLIESGELSVDSFLDQLEEYVTGQVEFARSTIKPPLIIGCPSCGCQIAFRGKVIQCPSCEFKLFIEMLGVRLTLRDIEAIIKNGKSRVIPGFKSAKTGKLFNASIKLDAEKKGIEFEIEKSPEATMQKKAKLRR